MGSDILGFTGGGGKLRQGPDFDDFPAASQSYGGGRALGLLAQQWQRKRKETNCLVLPDRGVSAPGSSQPPVWDWGTGIFPGLGPKVACVLMGV